MKEMPSIYIIGAAAVLISTVKLDDWKQAELLAPETTEILDRNGETVFRATWGNGTGVINDSGITWGSYVTDEGYATVTLLLDEDIEDPAAVFMEQFTDSLAYLAKIERMVRDVLDKTSFNVDKNGFHLIRI